MLALLSCAAVTLLTSPTKRVVVVGGGFAGLTAARGLAKLKNVEVLLADQRTYFEYTPGILRAWVKPETHRWLVNPIPKLLPKRAAFQRVLPGYTTRIFERDDDFCSVSDEELCACPLRLTMKSSKGETILDYPCDYVVLATGGELGPVSDDRQTADGSIAARRARLEAQVRAVMQNSTSALVIGGGLTGVELAAECAEHFARGSVTLAVGPTQASRGTGADGDCGDGILPGFASARGLDARTRVIPYVRQWLDRSGVRVLERWAVPPPVSSTISDGGVAAFYPKCARSWRDGGDGAKPLSWEEAGAGADLAADAVFDCRGLRPNNARAYGVRQSYAFRPNLPLDGARPDGATAGGVGGLPDDVVDTSGWLIVDDRFRLSRARQASGSALERARTVLEPAYGGRVYCCGDAACKDKGERTAANAHAEGEYVATAIAREIRRKRPMPPYVRPLRLTAVSLGKWDGVIVLASWVALRGWLAAIGKQFIQWYFVNFLPLPYWLLRRLPGSQPRTPYEVDPRMSY